MNANTPTNVSFVGNPKQKNKATYSFVELAKEYLDGNSENIRIQSLSKVQKDYSVSK